MADTYQVVASTDDAFRRLGTLGWDLTASMNSGAASATVNRMGAGARFKNILIVNGATITEAHLTLRCNSSTSGTVVNSRVSAEDVDDAITFADDADAFDTRWAARTTARVDWDAIPAWTSGVDYDSPDIKTVIKEIVDRGGWASGQDIVIFWEDFEQRSTEATSCFRQAFSYDGSAEFAPKLVITVKGTSRGWMRGLVHGGRRHRFSGRR